MWLSAGAMTLGMGAAMVGGAAIAAADTGADDGPSSHSASSSSGASDTAGDASRPSSPAGAEDSTGSASTRPGSHSAEQSVTSGESTSNESDTEDTDSEDTDLADTDSGDIDSADTESAVDAPAESPDADADDADLSPEPATAADSPTATEELESPPTETEPAAAPPAVSAGGSTKPGAGNSTAVEEPVTEPAVSAPAATPAPAEAADTTPSPVSVSDAQPTRGTAALRAAAAADVASATAPTQAVKAWAPVGLPAPNQLLAALQNFAGNAYLTVLNQIYGVQRNLNVLREDLVGILGIRRVVITQPLPFGDPAITRQYFAHAQDYYSAALATIAMAYGQLTGTTPDLQAFLDAAQHTDSLVHPNQTIYLGPGSTQFVKWSDSYELLQDSNVRIIKRYYGSDQWDKAFNDLTRGLQDSTKAMIVPISGLVDGRTGDNVKTVVVLGIDNATGMVTINDPTRSDGQGLTMSIDEFKAAWSTQKYELVTTQLASAPLTPAPPPSRTKLVWSLPAPDKIGLALQSGVTGVARAFVHQLEGVQANFADFTFDLARTFGVAEPVSIAPPAPGDIEYGDYSANYQYWTWQGQYQTCVLMATAAIIGQLTGTMPPGQEVIDLAESTPSGVKAGPIYTGDGTYYADAVTLLNMYGLNADYTTYLQSEGDLARAELYAALNQKQGVMVSVNNRIIYNAYTRQFFNRTWMTPDADPKANHGVVVLSVNLTKNVVYLSDSAPERGQGLPVPLDEFMTAWRTSGYAMVTAERRTV